MADQALTVGGAGSGASAPLAYTVPGTGEIILKAAYAHMDGTSAGVAWLPCLRVKTPNGGVMLECLGSQVSAGGLADVTWFPGVDVGGGGTLEVTDGTTVVKPTSEIFAGAGLVLTQPVTGEAQLVVHATGAELAYQEVTTSVAITGTQAAQQTVYTLGPVTYDGSTRVRIETYTPTFDIQASGAGSGNLIADLWIDTTDLGRIGQMNIGGVGAAADNGFPQNCIRFYTPSAGSHTFYIKYWSTVGTPTIEAGTGAGDTALPAWARISVG